MLHFATGNASKLREVCETLAELRSPVAVTNIEIDLPEMQGSMREITLAKVEAARRDPGARYPLIIEDTSLVFSALKQGRGEGLPGPYIKWFLENLGLAAIAAMLDPYQDRSATFYCCIALLRDAAAEPELYTGTTTGTIVAPASGGGFGWDAIFVPAGSTVSYAEMPAAEKRAASARTRALEQLAANL